MADLDASYDIDGRAQAIANYQHGVLVCLAGPGTGKTYSLLRRIEALTKKRRVDMDRICYLTFVKVIAEAFAADYEEDQGLPVDGTSSPRISTLHSFACRLVRNQGFRLGLDGALYFMNIAAANDDRSQVFFNDSLPFVRRGQLRTVARLRGVLEEAKEAWRNETDPSSPSEPASAGLPLCLRLSRAYRLIDWDQAVPLAHALLKAPDEAPGWIARIEHILVDEFQDFNRAEQSFINTLASTAESTVVVGDVEQSLYSGRGGSPDGLGELYCSEEVDQISLVRCYRCRSRILKAANTFLGTMRPDRRPMVPKCYGGQVACHGFKSRKAEVAYLVDFLKGCIEALPEEPRPKDGVACLFPNWKALDSYMACLVESRIPCCSRKPPPRRQRAWLELALTLIYNPEQRFVERLLLEYFGDIKPPDKRAMVSLVLEHDISPVEAMNRLASMGKLSGAASPPATRFCDLCRALSSQDAGLIASRLAEHLAMQIPDVYGHVDTFIRQLDQSKQEDAISNLCDTLIPESAIPPDDLGAVLCLTIHGSKGLSRKTVAMPGLEDAWLPGDVPQTDVHERRRLFYVALTRATDQVLITYPRTRARGDPLNYAAPGRGQPSRFIRQSGIRVVSC